MTMRDALLAEFDQEAANTRRTLERVPENKFDWRPHKKSFTMKELASHLANIAAWTPLTLNEDSFDMAPPDGSSFTTPQASSTQNLLEIFDRNTADAREAIANASDEQFTRPWTLLRGGEVQITMPKGVVLRSFIFNHAIHHRAQLTVYLRLNDIPVPSIYGQSADESGE